MMSHSEIAITVDHPISIDEHRSVEYGVLLALYLKATVHLMHVIRLEALAGMPVSGHEQASSDEVGGVSQMQQRIRNRMEALQRKIEHMSKEQVPVEIHVEAGYHRHQLVEGLKPMGFPLMVVGHDAKVSTWEYLWGDMVTELLSKGDSNLLVVPEQARFRPLHQVAYLFHGEGQEEQDLIELKHMVEPFGGHIQLVGIMQPSVPQSDLHDQEKRLRQHLPDTAAAAVYFEAESAPASLAHYLEEHPVEMLAIRHHHKNLFARLAGQDITRNMLFKTDKPLLIFKDTQAAQPSQAA
jgi:hypothetical protein